MRMPIEAASAWYKKAELEKDVFDRFVYLWFAFNVLYNEYLDMSESNAIQTYVEQNFRDIRNVDDILDSPEANYFKNRIVRNCKVSYRQDTSELAFILKNPDRPKLLRLKKLIMIIYQVRCNLFHGNKMFSSESDQEVVKNAANALQQVMKSWVML